MDPNFGVAASCSNVTEENLNRYRHFVNEILTKVQRVSSCSCYIIQNSIFLRLSYVRHAQLIVLFSFVKFPLTFSDCN